MVTFASLPKLLHSQGGFAEKRNNKIAGRPKSCGKLECWKNCEVQLMVGGSAM